MQENSYMIQDVTLENIVQDTIQDTIQDANIIQVKIIRHANRLDYANFVKWMFQIGRYWCDSPLTAGGHTKAREKGLELSIGGYKPKYIYMSPYTRTMETATEIRSIFQGAEMVVEPLLAEYQPSYAHTIELYPQGIPTIYDGIKTNFTYPESSDSFAQRVQFIISELIKKNNSDIMIVTHGEVLKSYINAFQNTWPHLLLDPGSTPYLTCLSFCVDKQTNKPIPQTIRIDF
jgi:broad specificity phosphatase PhoE